MLKVAYSPIYKYELPNGHRFPMIKYELIPEQLIYEGTLTEEAFFHPNALSDEQLLLTHSKVFLDKLNTQDLTRREIRDIGFPVSEALITRGKHIAHGTLDCANFAFEYGVAMNVAGGTHHSYRDRGEGFCVFNDIAIASNILLSQGKVERVLIVDLDVHQGNGTAKLFADDARVFTYSIHGEKNYPLRKEISDMDIGLPDKCGDQQYLDALKSSLPDVISAYRPDLIFYLSGVDILESDKLGRLSVSLEGCKARDQFVLEMCRDNSIPVAIVMGGGYSEKISTIVDAHANTFRLAQQIFF